MNFLKRALLAVARRKSKSVIMFIIFAVIANLVLAGVAIARALASNSDVILADEPTGNLDVDTAKEIISLFQQLAHQYDKCAIVVSHSQEVAESSDIVYKFEKAAWDW